MQPNAANLQKRREFNRWVDIVNEFTQRVIANATVQPPEHLDTVYEDGQNRFSWKLYGDRDGRYEIHLLTDGRLVYTMTERYVQTIKREIRLRHLRDPETSAELDRPTLEALCGAVQRLQASGLGASSIRPAKRRARWRR